MSDTTDIASNGFGSSGHCQGSVSRSSIFGLAAHECNEVCNEREVLSSKPSPKREMKRDIGYESMSMEWRSFW